MNNQTYTVNYCQQMTAHILAELDTEWSDRRDRFAHLGDGPAGPDGAPYSADELRAILDEANRRYMGLVREAYGKGAIE
jgi:hypothetical protein